MPHRSKRQKCSGMCLTPCCVGCAGTRMSPLLSLSSKVRGTIASDFDMKFLSLEISLYIQHRDFMGHETVNSFSNNKILACDNLQQRSLPAPLRRSRSSCIYWRRC